jgi:prolipoprotein diacylglyceryltransferase
MIANFLKNTVGAVRAINEKYKTPHLKTTRLARICLGLLRGYLLLLVGILVFKFIQALH